MLHNFHQELDSDLICKLASAKSFVWKQPRVTATWPKNALISRLLLECKMHFGKWSSAINKDPGALVGVLMGSKWRVQKKDEGCYEPLLELLCVESKAFFPFRNNALGRDIQELTCFPKLPSAWNFSYTYCILNLTGFKLSSKHLLFTFLLKATWWTRRFCRWRLEATWIIHTWHINTAQFSWPVSHLTQEW